MTDEGVGALAEALGIDPAILHAAQRQKRRELEGRLEEALPHLTKKQRVAEASGLTAEERRQIKKGPKGSVCKYWLMGACTSRRAPALTVTTQVCRCGNHANFP